MTLPASAALSEARYYATQIKRLFDCALYHKNIAAICRCRHRAVFEPHQLWWQFQRKGWDESLGMVSRHLRCTPCWQAARGRGNIRVETTSDRPTITMAWPSESEWKRAISRYR